MQAVLQKFEKLAGSDSMQIIRRIPAQEMWRFFIDGKHQQRARGIADCRYPDLNAYRNLTIKAYLEQHDEDFIKSDTADIQASELYAVLYSYELSQILDDLTAKDCLDQVTIGDLLLFDSAWLSYEMNEPGYLQAMQMAYHFSLTLKSDFTIDDILSLHRFCGSGVAGSNYAAMPNEKVGEFRYKAGSGFPMVANESVSLAGLRQLLQNMQPHQYITVHLIDFEFGPIINFGLVHIGSVALKHPSALQYARYHHDQKVDAFDSSHPIDASFLRFNELLSAKLQNGDDIAEWLFEILSSCFYSLFDGEEPEKENIILEVGYRSLLLDHHASIADLNNEDALAEQGNAGQLLREIMQSLLSGFNLKIANSREPHQRLEMIVEYVQSCDQLHAFSDFNCRVLCVQLLQALLRLNRLPPTILDDPNQFDMYSRQELCDAIVRGMQRVFELIERKELYGISTDTVLQQLQAKPALASYLQQFKQFVANEERAWRTAHMLQPKTFRLSHLSHFAMPASKLETRQLMNNSNAPLTQKF